MKLVLENCLLFLILSVLTTVCANLSIKPAQDTITRPVGSSVVITCLSSMTTSIKWLDVLGREIGNGYHNPRVTIDSSNSNSQKLIITNTQSSDAGHYTCVGNVSGALQEKSIKLVVFKDITFDEAPTFQNMIANTNSTIICKVSGEPDPVIYWKFNGVRLTFGEKYRQTYDGLKVSDVTERDRGMYSCNAEIENAGLFESKNINVSVHVPPRILRGVGKNKGIEGENYNFTCLAEGYPPPTFDFYKSTSDGPDGPMVKIVGDNHRIVLGANSLSFRPTTKDDEGFYKCVAKNHAGANESAVGLYTVYVPAAVMEFRDVVVNENFSASVSCVVKGDPAAEVTMGRGHPSLNMSGARMRVEKVDSNTHKLHVMKVGPEDAGNYFCLAVNSLAEDIRYARIQVQYSPRVTSASPLVHIWADASRNLTVYFSSYPLPNVSWYFGTSELNSNATFKMFRGSNYTSLQVSVREIDQTWIYGDYRCILRNIIGQAETNIELKRATIPNTPKVTFLKSRATDIWLKVEPPEEDGGMPVLGYVVQNEGSTYEFGLNEEVRVTDLKPNTLYLLTVKARNAVGVGMPHKIKLQTQGISEPSLHVLNDERQQNRAFQHRISWKVNTTGGMPIIEYEILYKKLVKQQMIEFLNPPTGPPDQLSEPPDDHNADEQSWSVLKERDNVKHPMNDLVLTDLEPRSSYMFKLRARNAIGWSSFTSPTFFTTAEATQPELDLRKSRSLDLLLIIIVLFTSFLIIVAAIVDVLCCYCCDRGLTKAIYTKCSKSRPKNSTEKHNQSLLNNQASKERVHVSKTSCKNERGRFKKKRKDFVCEPVPV